MLSSPRCLCWRYLTEWGSVHKTERMPGWTQNSVSIVVFLCAQNVYAAHIHLFIQKLYTFTNLVIYIPQTKYFDRFGSSVLSYVQNDSCVKSLCLSGDPFSKFYEQMFPRVSVKKKKKNVSLENIFSQQVFPQENHNFHKKKKKSKSSFTSRFIYLFFLQDKISFHKSTDILYFSQEFSLVSWEFSPLGVGMLTG